MQVVLRLLIQNMHMKQNLPRFSRVLLVIVAVFFACGSLFAQTTPIRGIVVDDANQPLPGVSVLLKGTSLGTATGANGRFTISASKGSTLVFSLLGFNTQEVVIGAEANLSVTMKSNSKSLSEVTVTALGVKKEVKKLGYSSTEINGEELTTARDANPLNSMAGQVAGLSIGASAEFFGTPTVVLRGSKDVMYVVDGIPVNSDTYNFSSDDIETYTVLKGPNAAALYGFRGINGAIVITTKSGSKDKKVGRLI